MANNPQYKLLPHERMELMRDLAKGTESKTALAKKYGITLESVRSCAKRHEKRIASIAADIDNKWAGIWIADKRNRVLVLQEQSEALLDQLEDEDNPKTRRELRATLRGVAEELGQLTQKVESSGGMKITVNGVDLENLK